MSGSFDDDDEDNREDDEPNEVQGPPPPPYTGSRFDEGIDEEDVHAALEFLVAIEPPLGSVNTGAEYEAATMRRDYHGFTNDARYPRSRKAVAVVTSSLNEAWNGVGPWRR